MPANPNWARWVFASVATYLKQVAQSQQLPVLIEGLDERTTEFMNATDRCEVRITGPFTREVSRDWYQIEVVVNVLFVSRYEEQKNQYAIIQKTGVFQEAMDGASPSTSTETSPATTSTPWSAASRRSKAATTRSASCTLGRSIRPTG